MTSITQNIFKQFSFIHSFIRQLLLEYSQLRARLDVIHMCDLIWKLAEEHDEHHGSCAEGHFSDPRKDQSALTLVAALKGSQLWAIV